MPNNVFVVYKNFCDWQGDWVTEIDSVYFQESIAKERVEDIILNEKDRQNKSYNSWYECIEVLKSKKISDK